MTLTAVPRTTRTVQRPTKAALPSPRAPSAGDPSPAAASSGAVRTALPVTTLAQGARVAMDRTRRFTVLGQVPVVGALVVLWLWPLHLAIVGSTAGHIRHTPYASLSFCDGTSPRWHRMIVAVAATTAVGWLAIVVVGLRVLLQSGPRAMGMTVVVIVVLPALIEVVSVIEFAVVNPEWVTLRRERGRLSEGRTTYALTSLVATRDGHDFAGELMDLTYPQWQAADALVIGYPASKELISYYVRMGARREGPTEPSGRPARRRITFDCRRPLRKRAR